MTDVFAKALLKQFVINKHFETTCNIHSIDYFNKCFVVHCTIL